MHLQNKILQILQQAPGPLHIDQIAAENTLLRIPTENALAALAQRGLITSITEFTYQANRHRPRPRRAKAVANRG